MLKSFIYTMFSRGLGVPSISSFLAIANTFKINYKDLLQSALSTNSTHTVCCFYNDGFGICV